MARVNAIKGIDRACRASQTNRPACALELTTAILSIFKSYFF